MEDGKSLSDFFEINRSFICNQKIVNFEHGFEKNLQNLKGGQKPVIYLYLFE